jgi:hypothetical protein
VNIYKERLNLMKKSIKITESQYKTLLLSEQGDVKFDMQQKQRDGEPQKNSKKPKKEFKMDYNKLKSNPTPEYIATVLKNSEGFFGDNEAWAQAALESIKDIEVYDEVSSLLGGDVYNFVKGFMDTDKEYHTKGKTIDSEFRRISPSSYHFMCNNGMGVKSKTISKKYGKKLTIPNHSENCHSCTSEIREFCHKRKMKGTLITQKGKYWDEYFLRGDAKENPLYGGHWDSDDYTYCICMSGEERVIDDNVYFIEEGPVFKQGHPFDEINQKVLRKQFIITRKELERMNRSMGLLESFDCSKHRENEDLWSYQQCVTDNLSMAVSIVPVIGTATSAILDAANGISYVASALFGKEGETTENLFMAGISFLSMIPGFGEARTLLRFPRKSVIATTDMMWSLEKKQFLNMVDAKKYDDAFSTLKKVEKGNKYDLSKYGRKEVNKVIDNLKKIDPKKVNKHFKEFQKIVDTYVEGGLKRESLNNIMKRKDFITLVDKYGDINKAIKSQEFKKMLINVGVQVGFGGGMSFLFNYIKKLTDEIKNRNFNPEKEKEIIEKLQSLKDTEDDNKEFIKNNQEKLSSDENINNVVDTIEVIYDDPNKQYEKDIDWDLVLKSLNESKHNRKIKISESQFKKMFIYNEQSSSTTTPKNTCTPKFNQVVNLIKPILTAYNIKTTNSDDKVTTKDYTVTINNKTLCRFSFTRKTYDGDELTCIITDNDEYADSSWILYKINNKEIASGVYDTSDPKYSFGIYDVDVNNQKQKDSKIIKLFNLLLDGLNKNTVIAKKIKELDDFYSGLAKTDYVNITDIQTKKILDFINNNPNCKIYNNANNTTKLYNKFNSILKNQNKQAEIESNEIRKKLYDKILNC